MSQCSIVLCLALKQFAARATHENLAARLGTDAVADFSVTRYLRETHSSASADTAPSVDIARAMDDADQTILVTLEEIPFASIPHLLQLTRLSFVTVCRQLAQSLG
jgi:hypothetical protein